MMMKKKEFTWNKLKEVSLFNIAEVAKRKRKLMSHDADLKI